MKDAKKEEEDKALIADQFKSSQSEITPVPTPAPDTPEGKDGDPPLKEPNKIILSISCRSLINLETFSKTDPQARVLTRDSANNDWALVGTTETV